MKKHTSVYKSVFLAFMFFSFLMPVAADDTPTEESAATEQTVSDNDTSTPVAALSGKKDKKVKKTKEEKKAEKEAEKAAKEAEKAAKKAEKNAKKAAKKNADKTTVKAELPAEKATPVKVKESEEFGIIRLRTKSRLGSYTLSVIQGSGKTVPVLSTADEYTTNGFYLKIGRKIYSLCTDSIVKTSLSGIKDGVAIKYTIPNIAEVNVDFNYFPSKKNGPVDMVKVIATVTNKGKRTDSFAFKAILDTILGEKTGNHFYTSEGVIIRNEVMYRTLQNQKYFVSKNESASMQMFFSGADCTEPDVLAFANKVSFSKDKWEPSMIIEKAFDTVFSYNDSAVCSVWKPVTIAPGEKSKVVYYLAFAVEGSVPTGDAFIYGKNQQAQAEAASASSRAVEVISPYTDETNGGLDEFIPVVSENSTAPVVPYTPVNPNQVTASPLAQNEYAPVTADSDLNIKNMSKEQLTPEYIQALLDRIAALEEDSPTLNRQELLQLNAELDAILNYLRQ